MRKAFVTGSAGFVGRHLTRELNNQGWKVVHYNLRSGLDLLDKEKLREKLNIHRPDAIFHLAARAYVPESFIDPEKTFLTNVVGTINLLESVRQLGLETRIHIAGSSEEYGPAIPDPKSEPDEPTSPYAVSKLAADHMARVYAKSYGMHIVVTRAFNHTGPGRGEMYAESSWAKQIAEYELDKREFISYGNLQAVRNYTDVRDMVKAYILAVDCVPGVYNVCSNTNVKMSEVLSVLKSFCKKDYIQVYEDPARMRPQDFSFHEPSCAIFQEATGWKPEVPFHKTLKDLLDYWRGRI